MKETLEMLRERVGILTEPGPCERCGVESSRDHFGYHWGVCASCVGSEWLEGTARTTKPVFLDVIKVPVDSRRLNRYRRRAC